MSHEGKMRRGLMYINSKKPLADNLKADVEYFLEQTKPKAIPKEKEEPKKEKKE